MTKTVGSLLTLGFLVAACGDETSGSRDSDSSLTGWSGPDETSDGSDDGTATGDGSGGGTSDGSSGSGTDGGSGGGDTADSGSGDDSAGTSGGGTTTDSGGVSGSGDATDSGGSSDSGAGTGTTGGVDPTTAGSTGDDSGGGIRFDVGSSLDVGGGEGTDECPTDGGATEFDFSYIWIANSPEGTVSKIDTVTATEVARYRTGAGTPDPSRTSVNLEGDVAVLNRTGSVTKIAARLDDCVDTSGDGNIQTSTGPGDILPWGDDECVLWHTALDYTAGGGPRSIAWNSGDPMAECPGTEADVWVGFKNNPADGKVRRLDGATGSVEDMVDVANWNQVYGQGLYGGAMDGDGNLWIIGKEGALLRMDTATLQQTRWNQSPPNGTVETFYGFAVDGDGTPWIAGQSGHLYRFNPGTETFDTFGTFGRNYMGMAIDRDGFAWMAYRNQPATPTCGVTKFDLANESVVDHVDLPGCSEPVGVSIDVEGFVWVVDRVAAQAYKVDPDNYTSVTVTGLVEPYTYSDMTGAGLRLVTLPPG